MSAKQATTALFVAERALRDIAEIHECSIGRWGKRVAAKYPSDLESALQRLRVNPDLLQAEDDLHADVCFYRVNKHVLVCDRSHKRICLLTVIHASRDIPSRLADLQPKLVTELELLHKQLERQFGRRN